MKKLLNSSFVFTFTLLFFGLMSCQKDAATITEDSAAPQGTFAATRMGSIIEQNNTGSKGTIQLGQDSQGSYFVKFGSDFSTVLATGTVTVYLSTSSAFKADPGNGNPDLKLVGIINKNGEMYLKVNGAVEAKFTHLILWCGSANISFGDAELK